MTDRDALLATILDNPVADLPRLVFADWLDENGEPERAEFIRVQIEIAAHTHGHAARRGEYGISPEWEHVFKLVDRERELMHSHGGDWFRDLNDMHDVVVSLPGRYLAPDSVVAEVDRGFVAEVRCPLVWWHFGVCIHCEIGEIRDEQASGELSRLGLVRCARCNAVGHLSGHGHEVLRSHPVERVIATDREPYEVGGDDSFPGDEWHWYDANHAGNTMGVHPPSDLPTDLFRLLEDMVFESSLYKQFPTRETAFDALSVVLLAAAKAAPHD